MALAHPQVGILGGGQLARMLCESAFALGLRPEVFSLLAASSEVECTQAVASRHWVASGGRWLHGSREALAAMRGCDVLAIESEFLDTLEFNKLGVSSLIRPGLHLIRELQDKCRQKQILASLKVKTAAWIESSADEPPARFLARVHESWGARPLNGGLILKWSQKGYDGKGVRQVTLHELERARRGEVSSELVEFFSRGRSAGGVIFAETRIAFKRELAQIGVRSKTGQMAVYPAVVSRQSEGICKEVVGPANAYGLSAAKVARMKRAMSDLLVKLEWQGVLALEWFEDSKGELWVNEIAPRVHNSGHYTQDAAQTSQFENHWRALLGYPLGSTECSRYFGMYNVLGPPRIQSRSSLAPVPGAAFHLHWYQKTPVLPGRKLGHLNWTASSRNLNEGFVKEARRIEKRWILALAKEAL